MAGVPGRGTMLVKASPNVPLQIAFPGLGLTAACRGFWGCSAPEGSLGLGVRYWWHRGWFFLQHPNARVLLVSSFSILPSLIDVSRSTISCPAVLMLT
jgi:hypothetical protein